MGLLAKSEGGAFELPPAGTHVARCFKVIDLGTQKKEYNGEITRKPQVMITWELPQVLRLDGTPFAVTNFYSVSLHEKAKLRQDLESWRGKKFTDEELAGFHIGKLLDATCLLSIIHHVTQTGNERAKIASISPVMKGLEVPPLINPPVLFDMDDYDRTLFESLTAKTQEMIKNSPEWQHLNGLDPHPPLAVDAIPDPNEDIPF